MGQTPVPEPMQSDGNSNAKGRGSRHHFQERAPRRRTGKTREGQFRPAQPRSARSPGGGVRNGHIRGPARLPLLEQGAASVGPQALLNLIRFAGSTHIELDAVHRPSLDDTIPLIGADLAHGLEHDGDGFAVAVLETGVEQLEWRRRRLWSGRDRALPGARARSTRRSLCSQAPGVRMTIRRSSVMSSIANLTPSRPNPLSLPPP